MGTKLLLVLAMAGAGFLLPAGGWLVLPLALATTLVSLWALHPAPGLPPELAARTRRLALLNATWGFLFFAFARLLGSGLPGQRTTAEGIVTLDFATLPPGERLAAWIAGLSVCLLLAAFFISRIEGRALRVARKKLEGHADGSEDRRSAAIFFLACAGGFGLEDWLQMVLLPLSLGLVVLSLNRASKGMEPDRLPLWARWEKAFDGMVEKFEQRVENADARLLGAFALVFLVSFVNLMVARDSSWSYLPYQAWSFFVLFLMLGALWWEWAPLLTRYLLALLILGWHAVVLLMGPDLVPLVGSRTDLPGVSRIVLLIAGFVPEVALLLALAGLPPDKAFSWVPRRGTTRRRWMTAAWLLVLAGVSAAALVLAPGWNERTWPALAWSGATLLMGGMLLDPRSEPRESEGLGVGAAYPLP